MNESEIQVAATDAFHSCILQEERITRISSPPNGMDRSCNGMDRSCAATIYPVLDKPRTTGAFQDRRKIEALLRPA